MKHWIWLRAAAVLQALGTVFHTMATARGAASHGPREQAVLDAMQEFHFDIMGSSRTVWDFYRGYEFSITVVFAVLAVLMWQLSNLSRDEPRRVLPLMLTILVCTILLDVLSWTYFFAGPGVMSALISLCLTLAVLTSYREGHAAIAAGRESKAS